MMRIMMRIMVKPLAFCLLVEVEEVLRVVEEKER
jgi:hypothetical protein